MFWHTVEEKLWSDYLSPMKHGSFINMHFLASKRSSDRINSVLWNMEVLQTCMFWHRREAPIRLSQSFKTWKFCKHACFGIEEKLRSLGNLNSGTQSRHDYEKSKFQKTENMDLVFYFFGEYELLSLLVLF